MHLDPYKMWRERTPRQIFQLLKTYKDMNSDPKKKSVEKKNYTVKSKGVKIPEWYKDKIPEGALVYNADDPNVKGIF